MEKYGTSDLIVTKSPSHENWVSFISEHPFGNIFQHPQFHQLFNKTNSCKAAVLAAVNEMDEVFGILLYVEHQEQGISGHFTRRSIIQAGPIARDNDVSIIQMLLKAYNQECKRRKFIYTEIRNYYDTGYLRSILVNAGYEFVGHLNILIDLKKSTPELSNEMHKKRTSNIRRAIKKGVYVRDLQEDEMEAAYNLITITYRRVNLPLPPKELFLNAKSILGEFSLIVGAFTEDQMIGCRFYLLFADVVYDWYAGSDENYFYLHPNDVIPWEMMLRTKELGYSTYDFGGAGHPDKSYGVRTYKERFGGMTVNFGRYKKIHRPLFYRLGTWGIRYFKYLRKL